MEWASVVSNAIIASVGIAGVGGAIISARIASESATKDLQLSIGAENKRAQLAMKQQIYVTYNDAVNRVHIISSSSEDKSSDPGRARLNDAIMALYTATTNVSLVGPEKVGDLAAKVTELAMEYSAAVRNDRAAKPSPQLEPKLSKLVAEMRADLGIASIA